MKTQKVVYTAIFGDYDKLWPVKKDWGADFICFTDNPNLKEVGWTIVLVRENLPTNVLNRRYKMLPHLYLGGYERSLYVDGNIRLTEDPSPLLDYYLADSPIASLPHWMRDCIYKEAEVVIELGLVDPVVTRAQMADYRQAGFPESWGLYENGVMMRTHHDARVVAVMTAWWEMFLSKAKRDQLSLSYLFWKHGLRPVVIKENPRFKNLYFELELHNKECLCSFRERLARTANLKRNKHWGYEILCRILC